MNYHTIGLIAWVVCLLFMPQHDAFVGGVILAALIAWGQSAAFQAGVTRGRTEKAVEVYSQSHVNTLSVE